MNTNFVITALVVAAIAVPGSGAPLSAEPQKLVRVFVQTDATGEEHELAGRQASVKDLREALASKKKSLAVVDDEDNADVEVEVVGRAVTIPKVVIGIGGISTRPGQPPTGAGPVKAAELRVRLTAKANDLAADFKNKNRAADNPRGWKSAATDLANQIDKWVFEHRASIARGDRDR